MNQNHLSASIQLHIDLACDRFEKQLRNGQSPRIEEMLTEAADNLRPELFKAVLAVELELETDDSTAPRIEDYLARFSQHKDLVREVFREVGLTKSTVPERTDKSDESSKDGSIKKVGQRLGHFFILDLLGTGSFGDVYKAHDEKLRRDVALKVPRASLLQTEESIARFHREGQAAAKLDHPNICTVYEIGEDRDTHFIVIAHIQGRPLSEHMAANAFSSAEATQLVATLARALNHAHEHGVVHRDVKPANVILVEKTGLPVITDFGLALQMDSVNSVFTEEAVVLGTPTHMSPEQARGAMDEVGSASDIYSLGVILYELLSGHLPFIGSVVEVLHKVQNVDPAPLSKHRPGIDRRLEGICLKAMSKAPKDRYRTMQQFAEDLEGFASRNSRGSAFVRLFVAGAFISLLILGFIAWRFYGRPSDLPTTQSADDATSQPNLAAEREGVGTEKDSAGVGGLPSPSTASAPPALLDFSLSYIASDADGDRRLGFVGSNVFDCRQGDAVRLETRFSQPAYAYLIALRADGEMELCWPEQETAPPPLDAGARYPPTDKPVEMYGLDEGAGLWAFLIVASSEPLPAFHEWRASQDKPPWKKQIEGPAGTVWNFGPDDDDIDAITAETVNNTRSKGRIEGNAAALVELLKWAKSGPHINIVQGCAFVARPR